MCRLDRLSARVSLILRGLGHALLALAMAFCLFTIVEMGADALLASLTLRAWMATALAGLGYGLCLAILALSWTAMVSGEARVGLRQSLTVYGPGVIAKYLPGSIFQYASRQAIGARYGFSQKAMVRASAHEALLHVACALLVAAIALVWQSGLYLLALAACGILGAIFGGAGIIGSLGRQAVFFSAFALFVAALAGKAIGISDPLLAAGVFMLAWLAGFLVPVAPGGIGVRESAFLALALPYEWGAQAAALAILMRVATGMGDAIFGAVGYWLMASGRANTQAS